MDRFVEIPFDSLPQVRGDTMTATVYVLIGLDPYEHEYHEELVDIFAERKDAESAATARYEHTFGKGSATQKAPYGGGLDISRYYEIHEHNLLTEWRTPEWMQR